MRNVAVVGAGTMGHGIAQVAAMAGCAVRLVDGTSGAVARAVERIAANLDKGVDRGKVSPEDRERTLAGVAEADLAAAVADADLVVESIHEDLDAKRALFADLDRLAPAGCVLATNTSSLPVGEIATAVADPGRVVGMHFFNPVHLMPLLEVVVAEATRAEVVDAVRAFGARLGKEMIVVRDSPGFATSRLGICLGMEAIRMLEEGVASAEDIDRAMVLGYRHPMGPLRLTDLVGLDVRLAIGEHLAAALGNPAFEPPALLRRLVTEGHLGRKSGRGFYHWD